MTIRTLLVSTTLATKLENSFQLPKNNNPVTFPTHTRLQVRQAPMDTGTAFW